jgi:hypothetical protein
VEDEVAVMHSLMAPKRLTFCGRYAEAWQQQLGCVFARHLESWKTAMLGA